MNTTDNVALDLGEVNPKSRGYQRLYRLTPPLIERSWFDGKEIAHEFVVVSAVDVLGVPETYIFPANNKGEVTDWGELEGSYQGGLAHDAALAGAGYTVVHS